MRYYDYEDDARQRKKEKKQRTFLEAFFFDLMEKCVAAVVEETMDELFEEFFGEAEFEAEDSF